MLRPQTNMDNINDVLGKKQNPEKEYTDNTAYEPQMVDMDINFSEGTLPITDELAAMARVAVESRIKNTKEYTKERIDRIDKNIKQYYSNTSVANDNKSLANVFFPETFNASEDWSDDLYLMFANMIDDLRIEDVGDNLEEFIAKTIEVTGVDDEKRLGFLRSLAKFLFKEENITEKDTFYFKKLDIIKEFLKRGLLRSGFKNKVEEFLIQGINSGLFVLKDDWGPTGEYKLCRSDKTKDGTGSYKYELDQEDVYRFKPVDSRLLIFPKHAFSWVIEKIPTTFHEVLNIVLDAEGNPVEGAKYDLKRLRQLAAYLKDLGANTARAKDVNIEASLQDDPETENTDLWDIDGDITLYEAHSIPLVIKSGGKKRPYKCMITMVNLSASETDEDPYMFPIGIQLTPYVAGIPYLTAPFIARDGDVGGMGLPESVRPLQEMLNNLTGHSVDLLNLGLWGIMIIDPDAFKDTTNLKEITPRMLLKLKNMKGRNVNDVINWLRPNLETIGAMGDMFELFQNAFSRTTRKGPSGEKVSPNPTATEFDTMVTELQKSVNKVGLRLNNLFSKMLERIYIYNILNMKERVKLKMQAFRLKDNENRAETLAQLKDETQEAPEELYTMNDKPIELTPEELFIDDISFVLDAADTFNKKSIEKQQSMQLTNLLVSLGSVRNPDGTPHQMIDDTGAAVHISEYQLIKKLLNFFDYDDVIVKSEETKKAAVAQNVPAENNAGLNAGQPGAPTDQAVPTPPLDASNQAADILQQANTLSPGINV